MDIKFHGKTAIVTGGTRGIGFSIAELLAESGATVIITGTSVTRPAELGDKFLYQQLDLTRDDSVRDFKRFIYGLESLDILINNAGVNIIEEIADLSEKNFQKVFEINLRGPLLIIKAAIHLMEKTGGRILNIGSIWSKVTRRGRTSYIVSKSGLDGLTRGVATDLADRDILVNTLSPGFVDTDLTRQSLSAQELKDLRDSIPIGRLAKPVEIAFLAAFLCSDKNTYLTGQNIVADGGFVNV